MSEQTTVLRPSAVVPARVARTVVAELETRDVSRGGVWSVSPGLWQRYDRAWDGPAGMRGSAQLLGTIGAVYGTPSRYDITIFRVTVTEHGERSGWSVEALCDDALQYGDLTLASCPRAALTDAGADPFRKKP